MTAGSAPAGPWFGRLLMVLALALAVRLVNLWLIAELPIAEYQFSWTEGDMNAHYRWSDRILQGDVLGRDTDRPHTRWMRAIAPPETWERWWGGREVFHKAPLYPYVLAGMRWLAGDSFRAIGLCQLVLALVAVGLVFLLAHRLFDRTVATVAALGAAFYGPSLLHETLLLRDCLGVTTSLLALWGLSRCDATSRGRWVVAGILLAIALLAREATTLFAPLVAVWIVQRFRGQPRVLFGVLGCFVAGVVLGLLPLFARNVAVGVRPWALSSLGLEALVLGEAADTYPLSFYVPPSARSIFVEADGRLGTALRLTLATYEGQWWRFVQNQALVLAAIFSSFEGADNVNWYYFRDRLPVLRWSVHFEIVLALGLVGLWLARGSAGHRLLGYFLLAALVGLLGKPPVVGRYKLAPAAVLMIYAAVAAVWIGRGIRDRRWKAITLAGVAAAAVLAVSVNLLRWHEVRLRCRAAEFTLAANEYDRWNQPERALEERRAALRCAYRGSDRLQLPGSFLALASAFADGAQELGLNADAAAELARLAEGYPRDAKLRALANLVAVRAARVPPTGPPAGPDTPPGGPRL